MNNVYNNNVYNNNNMNTVFNICNYIRIFANIVIIILFFYPIYIYIISDSIEREKISKKKKILFVLFFLYTLFDTIIRLFFSDNKWVQVYMLYTCFVNRK